MAVKWRIKRESSARERFGAQLLKITPEMARNLGYVNENGAERLAAMMVRFARGSKDSGDLIASIKYYSVNKGPGGGFAWRVSAGDEDAYYARMVEFGTMGSKKGQEVTNASGRVRTSARTHGGTDAQPFFYPALRVLRRTIRRQQRAAITKAVKSATS
jgi:hypothetical protein